jgi:hypothetical protein
MRNPKTAALDFEEFSYIDDQGTFRRIDGAWLDILCEYLEKHYQAQSVSEMLPYRVVWCEDTVPPPSERPFMIAGLVAVWLVQGRDKYPQVRFSSSCFGDPSALPGPGIYVELVQGIYATSTPEINRQPKNREGVCGAAIIRAREDELPDGTQTGAQGKTPTLGNETPAGQGSSPQVSTPKQRTLSGKGPGTPSSAGSATPLHKQLPQEETTGEIAGFMHWSGLQSLYNSDRLLCFADAVDGLIEDGWKVVSAPEK